ERLNETERVEAEIYALTNQLDAIQATLPAVPSAEASGNISDWLMSLPQGSTLPEPDHIISEGLIAPQSTRISPDGRLLAMAEAHDVRLYDARSGEFLMETRWIPSTFRSLSLTDDGRLLAVGTVGGPRLFRIPENLIQLLDEKHQAQLSQDVTRA